MDDVVSSYGICFLDTFVLTGHSLLDPEERGGVYHLRCNFIRIFPKGILGFLWVGLMVGLPILYYLLKNYYI
jgi:hypothetical protein